MVERAPLNTLQWAIERAPTQGDGMQNGWYVRLPRAQRDRDPQPFKIDHNPQIVAKVMVTLSEPQASVASAAVSLPFQRISPPPQAQLMPPYRKRPRNPHFPTI